MGSEMFKWAPTASATHTSQENIIMSNFSRTCNRFSQFLKERRSFGGDLNAIVSPNFEIKVGAKEEAGATEKKSLDLFPMTSSFTHTCSEDSTKSIDDDSRETPKSTGEQPKKTMPSMTIFYGGKVLVFDDFPEDKAQEIMSLARQGTDSTPQNQTTVETRAQSPSPRSKNTITTYPTQGLSDFPIARINSLHRFMEKRKDRIAVSAPYQVKKSSLSKSQHEKYNSMRNQQEEEQLVLKL